MQSATGDAVLSQQNCCSLDAGRGFHGTDATIAAGFDSGAQLGIPRLPRFASRYDIDSDATAREILANAVPTSVTVATGLARRKLFKEIDHVEDLPGAGCC